MGRLRSGIMAGDQAGIFITVIAAGDRPVPQPITVPATGFTGANRPRQQTVALVYIAVQNLVKVAAKHPFLD